MNPWDTTRWPCPVPPIRMSRHVHCEIMSKIASRPPEAGGILLGPVGRNKITDFYYDSTAACSGGMYAPDHLTLRRKMREGWLPAGLDMKGFVHSHPGRYDRLSPGDLQYIGRLLHINPDMDRFVAPIVIPGGFRLRAIVVLADEPRVQRATHLQLF